MADNPFEKLHGTKHPLAHLVDKISGEDPIGEPDEEILQVTLHLRERVDKEFVGDDYLFDISKRHLPIPKRVLGKVLTPLRVVPMVVSFAKKYGLMITGVNVKQKWVRLSGPVSHFEDAFNTELHTFEHEEKVIRINKSEIHIHESLGGLVESVSGLTRLHFTSKMHHKTMGDGGGTAGSGEEVNSSENDISGDLSTGSVTGAIMGMQPTETDSDASGDSSADGSQVSGAQDSADGTQDHETEEEEEGWNSLLPQDWAKIYNFPPHLDGSGQTIAILAMGGGYEDKYLEQYFEAIGIPMPEITWEKVTEKAKNEPTPKPTDGSAWFDYEVYMDIEIAAALAPGAKIVVYFTEDANPSEFNIAMKAIMADKKHDVNIVSISYGVLEHLLLGSEKRSLNETLREAALQGIAVVASSGDYGSGGGSTWNLCNPQMPASSPYVLAVGGTQLIDPAFTHHFHEILDETFKWEGTEHHIATGGGFSQAFNLPSYQEGFVQTYVNNYSHDDHTPPSDKRAYPDVGATASTNPGIYIQVAGEEQVGCGTSASAPLWAALIARFNQHLRGRDIPVDEVGLIHPYIYRMAGTRAFQAQESGNNGTYHAEHPWNPCTGLGTPDGMAMLEEIERIIAEITAANLAKKAEEEGEESITNPQNETTNAT